MPILITNLAFSYFETRVLDGITTVFDEGRVHLVVGPTGCGKSTLALVIAGLHVPQQGSVEVDGADPASKDFDRRTVQLAFQFPETQLFEITVRRELEYGLKNFGIDPEEAGRRCRWALDCVGLGTDLLERDPGTLSFGERRKVALASVIALKPKYLILDEPLAGLDWSGRSNLVDAIRRLKEEGLTTVVLTHETDLAGEIGDTVSVMRDSVMSAPAPVVDFLYSIDAAEGMVPEFILTVRKMEASGVKVPGKPHIVRDVARALAAALGLKDDKRFSLQ